MMSRPLVLRSEYGRLGNQIFQYAALRSLGGTLILSGFSDLASTFSNVGARIAPKYLTRLIDRLSFPGGRAQRMISPVVGLIVEDDANGRLVYAPGKAFYLCNRDVFFQRESPAILEQALNLSFRPEVTRRAEQFLQGINVHERDFFAIHVRGGDFSVFPSTEHPAQLPLGWILRQVDRLREIRGDSPLIVVGDDPGLKNEIAWQTGASQSRERPSVDLALMAMSSGGVVSNSTFAWWGSAFAAHRSPMKPRFLAPEYWLGHRLQTWSPPDIRQSSHLEFMPVTLD